MQHLTVHISDYNVILKELQRCVLKAGTLSQKFKYQGPVVQSIVSLTSSLRGQLVKCFMTL